MMYFPKMTLHKVAAPSRSPVFQFKILSFLLQSQERDRKYRNTLLFVCCCLATKSCPTLCDPVDYSLLGSAILSPWDSPGKNLNWVAIYFSRGSSSPRDRTHISFIGRQILYHWATREAQNPYAATAKSPQSCSTLCDPIDGRLTRPWILQARILEWVAISSSYSRCLFLNNYKSTESHKVSAKMILSSWFPAMVTSLETIVK